MHISSLGDYKCTETEIYYGKCSTSVIILCFEDI